MKAVVCTTLGEPNLLEIQDNPIPEPQKSEVLICLLYTSPSPRDMPRSRMPSSA